MLYDHTAFVGLHVKIDGFMHPQLNHNKLKQFQSKEGSKPSLWSSFTGILSKIKEYISSSSEGEGKYLPPLALRMYLSEHHNFLTGKRCENKSPIEIIADIIYIFNSLYKTFLQIDFNSWPFPRNDIQKVSFVCKSLIKYIYIYIYIYI